jgi:hypothetical protein
MQNANIEATRLFMIGKDDNQEEVSFKVADRRKFNADGSLKEGVTLEPDKPAERPEPKTAVDPVEPLPSQSAVSPDVTGDSEAMAEEDLGRRRLSRC